jgi:hypothetical protein
MSRRVTLVTAGWLVALVLGFRVLLAYELQAGIPAAAPDRWPARTPIAFQGDRLNIVLFAHPQCPCSAATFAELAEIITACPRQMHVSVCFFSPDEKDSDWTQSDLWRTAVGLPGVDVIADRNGTIASRFGSVTSGQVIAFDRGGHRVFAGGITSARGHQGDNRGRNYLMALARGELCTVTDTPVFGCSLRDPERAP